MIVKKHNEYYCAISETRGRGNCFFHALADQLTSTNIRRSISQRAREIEHDHVSVRKAIVKFMRESKHIYNDDGIVQWLNLEEAKEEKKPPGERRDRNKIWQDHLEGLNTYGTWAEETVIRAAAIFFAKDIKVINEDSVYKVYGSLPGQATEGQPMVIVHMNRSHFQSVHSKLDIAWGSVHSPSLLSGRCLGCDWSGKSIRGHIKRTKENCKDYYDMDALEEEAKKVHHEKVYRRAWENSERTSALKKEYYKSHAMERRLKLAEYRKKCKEKLESKNTAKNVEDIKQAKTILCSKCEMTFTFKSNLVRHMEEVHKKRHYRCSHCPANYKRGADIDRHVKRKHNGKDIPNISCNICEKLFTDKSNLRRHIKTIHTEDIKYECSICQKKFNKKCNLDRHINDIHHEEKKYNCPVCPEKFSRRGNLKRHMELGKHTFRVVCNYCDSYTFYSKSQVEAEDKMDKHYIQPCRSNFEDLKRSHHSACLKFHCVNEENLSDQKREELLHKRLKEKMEQDSKDDARSTYKSSEGEYEDYEMKILHESQDKFNENWPKILKKWRDDLKEHRDKEEERCKRVEERRKNSFLCRYCKTTIVGIFEWEHYCGWKGCECRGCRLVGIAHDYCHEFNICEMHKRIGSELSRNIELRYLKYEWKPKVDSGLWKIDPVLYEKYVEEMRIRNY